MLIESESCKLVASIVLGLSAQPADLLYRLFTLLADVHAQSCMLHVMQCYRAYPQDRALCLR